MEILAVSSAVWLDVAFFAILILGLLIGMLRGFVKGVCKLAGTFLSVFVAFTFCNALKNSMENWFGMTTALTNAFKGSATAANWVSVIVCFIMLVIVVKLLSWLLGKIGTGLVERSDVCKTVNRVLGAILGLAEGAILVFMLLTICYWIPSENLHSFLGQGDVVGKIFNWDTFRWAAEFNFLKG